MNMMQYTYKLTLAKQVRKCPHSVRYLEHSFCDCPRFYIREYVQKKKTPTILVSKMCPFAFYTTHTVLSSPHTSNRFAIAMTVISETARCRSRLKVVGINLFFALSSYPTENTVSQFQRPITTRYYHKRT